jgi:hypothetical protein
MKSKRCNNAMPIPVANNNILAQRQRIILRKV